MNIRWFAGALTLLTLLARLMPQAAVLSRPAHSQRRNRPPLRLSLPPTARSTSPSRPSISSSTATRRPSGTRRKRWPAASPSSITTTTAISTSSSPTAPISRRFKDFAEILQPAFRKRRQRHFTDVTEKAGLAGTGFDIGVAVGDYDNDGYEDIFVAGVYRNTLYHNNGDGTFTDVTAKAGLE